MAEESKAPNGAKAFGGILAIVALITGMAAIVRPMQGQIDQLQQRLDLILLTMEEDDDRERDNAAKFALLTEKFVEVETQFDNLDERTLRIEVAARERMDDMDKDLTLATSLALDNVKLGIVQLDEKLQIEMDPMKKRVGAIEDREREMDSRFDASMEKHVPVIAALTEQMKVLKADLERLRGDNGGP